MYADDDVAVDAHKLEIDWWTTARTYRPHFAHIPPPFVRQNSSWAHPIQRECSSAFPRKTPDRLQVRRGSKIPGSYQTLEEDGSCRRSEALFLGRYFAVAKKKKPNQTSRVARAIFNGKKVSESRRPPWPAKFRQYFTRCARTKNQTTLHRNSMYILYTGDFRHFFHQTRRRKEDAQS